MKSTFLGNVTPNRQVSIFNETISNVTTNVISHETTICDDRDPPWINSKIKNVIKKIKNSKNTLIINQTFYFYKILINSRLK